MDSHHHSPSTHRHARSLSPPSRSRSLGSRDDFDRRYEGRGSEGREYEARGYGRSGSEVKYRPPPRSGEHSPRGKHNEERDFYSDPPSPSHRSSRSLSPQLSAIPQLHSIHQGNVVNIKNFGIFVKIRGFQKHGLVHISQISNQRLEASQLNQIVNLNDPIWVKVIQVGTDDTGKSKLSLSMKFVKQSDGTDLDPNNVNLAMDQQRSRSTPAAFKLPRFEIGAVLDTVCQRCGGKGHFASECFHIKGEEIQQMLSDEENGPQPPKMNPGALKEHLKEQLKEEKHKHKHNHDSKKRKRHSKDKSKKEKKDKKKEKEKKKKKHKKH